MDPLLEKVEQNIQPFENTPFENTPLEKRLAKQEAKSVSGVKGVEIRKIFYFANQ